MKKYILKYALIAFVFSNLGAQSGRKIAGGFRLGGGVSDIFYQKIDAKPQKLAKEVSLFVDFPVQDVYAISTGIGYFQKGFREKLLVDNTLQTFAAQPDAQTWTIDYLQIPLCFSYREHGFRLDAGIYGAYALGGVEKWLVGKTVSYESPLRSKDNNVFSRIRRIDGGLAFGAGYSGKSGLEVMFNAQVGIRKIEKQFSFIDILPSPNPVPSSSETYVGRNLYIGLTVGYRFGG